MNSIRSCVNSIRSCVNTFKSCVNSMRSCVDSIRLCVNIRSCVNTIRLYVNNIRSCINMVISRVNTVRSCINMVISRVNTVRSCITSITEADIAPKTNAFKSIFNVFVFGDFHTYICEVLFEITYICILTISYIFVFDRNTAGREWTNLVDELAKCLPFQGILRCFIKCPLCQPHSPCSHLVEKYRI